ncbi:lysophospholipid acyltransferase family protein [Actinokineospora globicatena]|uniref:lysophospholipid acyltransferase family protein n=1 Tax=Actinokineospora globicatena TaxID=103729 RepID=UPI0020A311A8|nr:lysophospholipid acyltransferase family protein [Actinokineospora globicatena]MCP2305464.1 1-acyl-sn-glycerol-3-phosphate acyltransferases [Actinokineospora globicatena]GLW81332.1 1-acyl-sn-glycerol-3-phosphate acyltransferase [Actinokineospora globicatena]GLW87970.1 1-acyl-sn-glycerol-3-phosphate acyltransferase [Actinokineospora globicatena]
MAHDWMPTSPCGPTCLTTGEARVSRARVVLRLTGAVGVLLVAALSVPLMPVIGRAGRELLAKRIFRAVLRSFGVRLVVRGADALRAGGNRGALVATNHISWLDIAAVNAVRPMRAIAKVDIRTWPVLGRVVAAAGTLFIDRERLRTLPGTVTELATTLRAGSLVYFCPEGTTWCGQGIGKFRPALFQAAIDGGVPVRPIALRFHLADGRETTTPAFIGTETIIESIRRVAALRGLVLELTVLDELAPGRAANRQELAALTEAAINSALDRVTPLPTQRRRPRQVRVPAA